MVLHPREKIELGRTLLTYEQYLEPTLTILALSYDLIGKKDAEG